jgi:hypothetical protein
MIYSIEHILNSNNAGVPFGRVNAQTELADEIELFPGFIRIKE